MEIFVKAQEKILYIFISAVTCCLLPLSPASAQNTERGFRVDMKNTAPVEQFDITVLMKELARTVELYAKNEKKDAALSIPCKILF